MCIFKNKKTKMESISILLAAGFSAPKGYPVGNTLNESLTKLDTSKISFSPDGRLAVSIDGNKPDFGYRTSYDLEFEFCLDLIKHYNQKKGNFDYEEFYDYLLEEAVNDKEAEDLATDYLKNKDYFQIIFALRNIYNQLVAYFLKDGIGTNWYDNEPYQIGNTYSGYTGFLRYLKHIGNTNIVNIHTLNHDLFFESLNKTDFLSGELCDGFEELGSQYYGTLSIDNRSYKCRLQRYTGDYSKKYRLFKLHGSLDYCVYYRNDGISLVAENYIKSRYAIGVSNILKEIRDKKGILSYERCFVNYHADFLTGTTSKIKRYEEPLLYNKLFDIFKANLKDANKLIIVGYGAKDSEVNKLIVENFDFKNKKTFIVDPYAGTTVESFARVINAKIIKKQLESLILTDFD